MDRLCTSVAATEALAFLRIRHEQVLVAVYGRVLLKLAGVEPSVAGVCEFLCRFFVRRIAGESVHPAVGATCLWTFGRPAEMSGSTAYRALQPLAERWAAEPANRAGIEERIRQVARHLNSG